MAVTLFWRCEGLTLDPADDFSAGDTVASLVSSASISAAAARIGSNGLASPSGGDYAEFAVAGGDLAVPAVGSAAFSLRLNGTYRVDARVFELANGSGDYIAVDTRTGGELRLRYQTSGQGNWALETSGLGAVADTWYGVVIRWDQPNSSRRIEVYDAAGTLIGSAEDLSTGFVISGAYATARFGEMAGEAANNDLDNCFLADAYDEALEDNLAITSWSEYGGVVAPITHDLAELRPQAGWDYVDGTTTTPADPENAIPFPSVGDQIAYEATASLEGSPPGTGDGGSVSIASDGVVTITPEPTGAEHFRYYLYNDSAQTWSLIASFTWQAGEAFPASGSFSGSSSFSAAAVRTTPAAGSFAGLSSFSAAPRGDLEASGDFSGSSSFGAGARRVLQAAGAFLGSSAFAGDAEVDTGAAGSFAGSSSFSAAGIVIARAAGAFAGSSSFSARPTGDLEASGNFTGSSTIAADGRRRTYPAAAFAGSSAIAADGIPVAFASGSFAGSSSIAAAPIATFFKAATFTGRATFRAWGLIPAAEVRFPMRAVAMQRLIMKHLGEYIETAGGLVDGIFESEWSDGGFGLGANTNETYVEILVEHAQLARDDVISRQNTGTQYRVKDVQPEQFGFVRYILERITPL